MSNKSSPYAIVKRYLQETGSHNRRIQLKKKTLFDAIEDRCKLSSYEAREAFMKLQERGEVVFPFPLTHENVPKNGTMKVNLPPLPKKDFELRWEEALNHLDMSPAAKKKLNGAAEKFKDFSSEDLKTICNGLSELASERTSGKPKYLASAENLLGSSKLIDALNKDILNAFEIDIESFKPSPKYIAVAGPPTPKAVVLVENPNSFEAAVLAGASKHIAWLCSYGFGLANEKSDQDGMLLESNLTTYKRHAVVLVREGEPPRKIEELLAHPRLYFWGDLDLSGIQIFDRLKRKFQEDSNASELQLSALYQPMLEALKDGRNHPYVPLIKGNQIECELHDEMAQRVSSLCCERAVDQEIVHEGFEELGSQPLSEVMIKEFFHE